MILPEDLHKLVPANKYGESKHRGDIYIFNDGELEEKNIIGLKFFNVYGPNEYHKGNMASAVKRMYEEYRDKKRIVVLDGGKKRKILRDFIYIKDVLNRYHFS